MKVVKVNQVPAEPGVGTLFTGPVTRQPIIAGDMSKQFIVSQVNFSKGVRNKFHTHTSDQILIVTAGKGICATEKEEVTVGPGDVILFPAGESHWHGATKDSTFSHIYVAGVNNKTTQVEK
ncbi:MAG TPA: cupin domain-containing protein [Candidatus Methylomirabilis sp.]|nr:cupin domain-containing protein [Candidatus Methylomirabilis sp.]